MSPATRRRWPWRSGLLRVTAAIAAFVSIGLLVTAHRLEPHSSGLGTHHQLGLPPCTIRVIFGMRCPSCGMTTSWAYFMRADLVAAAKANLGGLMLAVYVLGSLAVTLPLAFRGRMPRRQTIRNATIALTSIALVTIADWLYRLMI